MGRHYKFDKDGNLLRGEILHHAPIGFFKQTKILGNPHQVFIYIQFRVFCHNFRARVEIEGSLMLKLIIAIQGPFVKPCRMGKTLEMLHPFDQANPQ